MRRLANPIAFARVAALAGLLAAVAPRVAEASQCGFVDGGQAGRVTCGLRADHDIQCWGDPNSDLLDAPAGSFTQLSIDDYNACASRTDGSLACWSEWFTQLAPPAGEFVQFDMGYPACGIRPDGSAECWGEPDEEVIQPPHDTFLEVGAGDNFACGIRDDHTVVCWGESPIADEPPTGLFASLAISGTSACGIHVDGSVECWAGIYGTPPAGDYTDIAVGFNDGCAVQTTGALVCWQGMYTWEPLPGSNYSKVFMFAYGGCGVDDSGTMHCWGDEQYAEMSPPGAYVSIAVSYDSFFDGSICGIRADGSPECWSILPQPEESADFSKVSMGAGGHACGLHNDGTVECWAANTIWGLTFAPPGAFTDVSSGSGHACGLRPDATVDCWGTDPDEDYVQDPVGTYLQVSAGYYYNCAIHTGGAVSCWGSNFQGETDSPPGQFVEISSGYSHSCGIRPDASVECWGSDTAGESSPPPGSFSHISVGRELSCGLHPDGTAECWGYNEYGQADPPAGAFTSIEAGYLSACGLRADGDLVCWGSVNYAAPSACAVCGNGEVERVEECDDGGVVSNDGCSDQCVFDCPATPQLGCRSAESSTLSIKIGDPADRSALKWKWKHGAETLAATMSDPTEDGRYNLCLYPDGAVGEELFLPPRSRWSVSLRGFSYEDRLANVGGVSSLRLKPGLAGKASLDVKAGGANMSPDLLPTASYAIQLLDAQTGNCWGSSFPTGTLKENSFRARSSN